MEKENFIPPFFLSLGLVATLFQAKEYLVVKAGGALTALLAYYGFLGGK
jgi:hypothetical protein